MPDSLATPIDFGLEPVPESVKRLTAMLASRNGVIEDFARIVAQDPGLSERLLRAANPRATRKEDYRTTTVEDALLRTGMSMAFLLAMSDPLVSAVGKTFLTMLDIDLKAIPPAQQVPFKDEHVLGEVTFAGKTTGLVHLRVPGKAVSLFGEKLLGLTADDLADPEMGNDVIGEICNMIVGNFKSNLCDAGLNCKLNPPKITPTADFKLNVVKGGTSERHGFAAPEFTLFVDLSVNPSVNQETK